MASLNSSGFLKEEPVAREIAQDIEAMYPGYRQVPSDLRNEVVPDVTMFAVAMGEATIAMFLFPDVWTWDEPNTPGNSIDEYRTGKVV